MADRETVYNTALTKIRHTNYVRNSRAIVVLWAFFTIVFVVLNVVVFLQPQWIGDSGDSAVAGFFGLFRRCEEITIGDDFVCSGDFVEWDSILNSYFKACSVMVGISCLLFILCVGCFFLFFLLNTATVLQICAWFQLLSGILMAISCVVYPAGWDDPTIRVVCGLQADKYDLGVCDVRWGFILAIVLVFDAFILSILAFVLAAKQANLMPEAYKSSDKDSMENFALREDSPPPESHSVIHRYHHQHYHPHHQQQQQQQQQPYDMDTNNHEYQHDDNHNHHPISRGDYTEHHYVSRPDLPLSHSRPITRRVPYHDNHIFVID